MKSPEHHTRNTEPDQQADSETSPQEPEQAPDPRMPWVTALRDHFFNRTDTLAILAPWGKPTPVLDLDEEHLMKLLHAHVTGQEGVSVITKNQQGNKVGLWGKFRLGSYCPTPVTNETRWLCIDIDAGAGHKAQVKDAKGVALRIYKRGKDHGVPIHLELSKSGEGLHAWVFFAEPVQAKQARALGLALCPSDVELEEPTKQGNAFASAKSNRGLEVFPKQIEVKEGGYGNMVWLPWCFMNEGPYGGCFGQVEEC